MPRLGGGTYKSSYLVGSGASQTQVMEEAPHSGKQFVLPVTLRSESPPVATTTSSKTRKFKCAESGSGSLLPDYNHSNNNNLSSSVSTPALSRGFGSNSRVRTLSDMSHNTLASGSDDAAQLSPSSEANAGLRRRSTAMPDEESSMSSRGLQRRHSMSTAAAAAGGLPTHNTSSSSSTNNNNRRSSTYVQVSTKGFTIGHLLQACVVAVVFYLVYDAHFKVQEAAHRLEHYKQEEAMLIDQMDRIEDRAMQLQDQLKKLRDDHNHAAATVVDSDNTTKEQTRDMNHEIYQWKREYFEVNKEVHALQDFMQDGARKELSNHYGGGAVHVNLDLNLGGEASSQIAVELFEEAPHASWVFVQQIENGDWSQANFIWHPAHMVLASPTKAASVKLEFIEKSYHHHEAWTIGLTRSHNGGYNLYVNLQDNSHVHEGDVCLGKIVGGFDTLQKLMHLNTVAKQTGGEKAYLDPPVGITDMTISTAKRSRTRRN